MLTPGKRIGGAAIKAKQRILSATRVLLVSQGVLALGFGLAAMLWPGITGAILASLFGVFLVADGAVLIALGVAWHHRARTASRVWWGILQMLVGLYVLWNPRLALGVIILILGITLLTRGMFNLAHALAWKHEAATERILYGAMGLLGIIIGGVVAMQPTAGGLAFVWIVGLYAVASGSALIRLGMQRQPHSNAPVQSAPFHTPLKPVRHRF